MSVRIAKWAVKNQRGKIVALFDYRCKADANELAARLSVDAWSTHFVALEKIATPFLE